MTGEFELPCSTVDEPYWGTPGPGVRNLPKPVSYSLHIRIRLDDWMYGARQKEELKAKDGFVYMENKAQYQKLEKKRRDERNLQRRPAQQRQNQQGYRDRGRARGYHNRRGGGRNARGGGGYPYRRFQRNIVIYHPSITVNDSYHILRRIPLSEISRSPRLSSIPQGKDLHVCGTCGLYPIRFDNAKVKQPIKLSLSEKKLPTPLTTLQDPNMRGIVTSYGSGTKPVVILSDLALAALMTSARSVHSWDLSATKHSRFIFIDYRDDRQSRVERTWVSETAPEREAITDVDPTAEGSASKLSEESQAVNDAFRFASLRDLSTRVNVPGTTCKTGKFASTGVFRYRRFILHEGTEDEYDVVVRSELDAAIPKANKRGGGNAKGSSGQFVRMFALLRHEALSSPPWTALDESRGALMAAEAKLNACKFARWAVYGVVSNAHQLKIAFVKRDKAAESTNHSVVGVETVTPIDFATQIGFSLAAGWSAFDFLICHVFLGQFGVKGTPLKEGIPAIFMRDNARPEMMLFISPEEFSDDEETDDDEEEE